MEVKYQKTLRCQQTLYDELMKIIEGAEKEEIERSINLLEETFSLSDLKANLSSYYILYDGFEQHFRGIMEPFVAQEKGEQAPKPSVSPPQGRETPPGEGEAKPEPERQGAEAFPSEGSGQKAQESAPAPPSSSQDMPFRVAGAQLEGQAYERIQNQLLRQLKDFQNIDSVNFKMDYQVEVYANEVTDNLLQQIQEIEHQVQPNIPEFRLRLNVRKDRRNRERQEDSNGSQS
jgi:hypothetical protein